MSAWLRGSVPYMSSIRKIAERMGVREQWLLHGEGPMQNAMEEPGIYGTRSPQAHSRARTIAELSALLPDAGPSAREELLKRIQELIAEEQRK